MSTDWRSALQMIKPMLAERTIQKVVVLGSDYRAQLLDAVPAESLPVRAPTAAHHAPRRRIALTCPQRELGGAREGCYPSAHAGMQELVVPRGGAEVVEVLIPGGVRCASCTPLPRATV